MKIIGIIAEYNPFHNGHLYHFSKIKELYPDSQVILVLNGYFLQRGEISFLSKEAKIKIALENNIDIVLELPVLFGTQSADTFAEISLKILNNFNVDTIIFGSESNDIINLRNIAKLTLKNEYKEKVKNYLNKGFNYPTSLSKALKTNLDFNNPNDLLAISYIKAIESNNYKITPVTIKRTNSYHDKTSNDKIISASNIRNKLFNNENINNYLPEISLKSIKVPNIDLLFKILKSIIISSPNLDVFLDVDEGINKRLKEKIKISTTLEEFIKNVKTKRYTYNKIQRMCTHILLGITKENNIKNLEYIKVLGFNKKGKKYLNKIKKDIKIPLNINKNSIIYKYEINASLIYDLINNTNTYKFETSNKPIQK